MQLARMIWIEAKLKLPVLIKTILRIEPRMIALYNDRFALRHVFGL